MIKTKKGKPGRAAGLFGSADGKGSRTTPSGTPGAVTGGDPLSQSVGQFGKNATYLPPSAPPDLPSAMPASGKTVAHQGVSSGSSPVRGIEGGMRRNPNKGSLQGNASLPSQPLSD